MRILSTMKIFATIMVMAMIFAFTPIVTAYASEENSIVICNYDLDNDGVLSETDFSLMREDITDSSTTDYRVSDLVTLKKELIPAIAERNFTIPGQVSEENKWFIRNNFANCEVDTITAKASEDGTVRVSFSIGDTFIQEMLFKVVSSPEEIANAEKVYAFDADEDSYNVWATEEYFLVEKIVVPQIGSAICAYMVSNMEVSDENTKELKEVFSSMILTNVKTNNNKTVLYFETEDGLAVTELVFKWPSEVADATDVLASARVTGTEVTCQLLTNGSCYWVGMVA